jgi:hypothetical protein
MSTFFPPLPHDSRGKDQNKPAKLLYSVNSKLLLLQQMLLKNVPGNLDLKCRVLSLLSHCYQAQDNKNLRKQVLQKGWELLSQAQDW